MSDPTALGPPGPVDPTDLDMVSAALRADMGDIDTFFEVLAAKLTDSLGGMVKVDREGGMFRKEHRAKRITVSAGNATLAAERDRNGVRCTVAEAVRGITLRTKELGLDEWLELLAQHLTQAAQQSAGARAALNNLLT